MNQLQKEALGTAAVIFTVFVVIFGIISIKYVDEGQRAVKTTFGDVTHEEPIEPGMAFAAPFVHGLHKMDTRAQTITTGDVSGSKTTDEHASQGMMSVKSTNGLNIGMDISVRYRLKEENATDIYESLGTQRQWTSKLVEPTIKSEIRNTASQYTAENVYSDERDEFQTELKQRIMEGDFERHGLVVEQVQLRDVQLPAQVEDSIESAESMKHKVLKKEREIELARKEAERKRVEAKGLRDSEEIATEAFETENAYLQYIWITEGLQKGDPMYVPFNGQGGMEMFKDVDKIPNATQAGN